MIWIGILLAIALPFILYAVIVGVTAGFTVKPVWRSLPLIRSKRRAERMRSIVAVTSIVIFVLGAVLLIYFWRVGGPNRGSGRHLFANSTDPYADLHVGMLLLFDGVALSVTVRAMERKVGRPHLQITAAVVAALLVGTAIFTLRAYDVHAGRAQQLNDAEIAKLQALPPLYVPVSITLPSASRDTQPTLMRTLNITTGYQLMLVGTDPMVEVVGWHADDVKAFFDPSANVCDISGLSLGKPVSTGTCQAIAHVNGGVLYTSTQSTDVYRPFGAFVKGDSVYYVASGTDQADLISEVSQLKRITPQEVSNYLTVAL